MKQILAIRRDLNLNKSQLAQVAAWASLFSAKTLEEKAPQKLREWLITGQKKVTIRLESLEDLIILQGKVKTAKSINFSLVTNPKDYILTVNNDIPLALGIGPDNDDILDSLTRQYKLL